MYARSSFWAARTEDGGRLPPPSSICLDGALLIVYILLQYLDMSIRKQHFPRCHRRRPAVSRPERLKERYSTAFNSDTRSIIKLVLFLSSTHCCFDFKFGLQQKKNMNNNQMTVGHTNLNLLTKSRKSLDVSTASCSPKNTCALTAGDEIGVSST